MSLVLSGRFLTIAVKDAAGDETTRTYQLSSATDAAADTDAATVLAAFDAISDAKISGYNITKRYVENAFTLPSDAEVENMLQVTMPISGKPNKSGVVTIPAPVIGVFVSSTGEGRNQPDFLDTALLAFLNLFTSPATIYVSDGEQSSGGNFRGKRVHAKSNKG
jgi:hypothetical protein